MKPGRRASAQRGLVALALLLTPACADKTVRPVGAVHYEPLPPDTTVQVFKSESEIHQPYAVIGVLRQTSTDRNRSTDLDDVLPALQDKARSIGANAIIIDSKDLAANYVSTVGVTVAARAIRVAERPADVGTAPEP